jgi:hypothetical protein
MSIFSNDWIEVPQLDHYGYYVSSTDPANAASRKQRLFDSGLSWNIDARNVVIQKEFSMAVKETTPKNGGYDYYAARRDLIDERERGASRMVDDDGYDN